MQACSIQLHGLLALALTAESTTALFACCSLGMTRSTMLSASLASEIDVLATASKMYTCSGLSKCEALFNRAVQRGTYMVRRQDRPYQLPCRSWLPICCAVADQSRVTELPVLRSPA